MFTPLSISVSSHDEAPAPRTSPVLFVEKRKSAHSGGEVIGGDPKAVSPDAAAQGRAMLS